MTHLLDTSALLAHFLGEPGAKEVHEVLAGGPNVAALAAPTWVEFHGRLRDLVDDVKERTRVFEQYTLSLCTLLPLDAEACLAAIQLRSTATERLPLTDALIAGTAKSAGLVLVHRDPHFDGLPGIKVLRLPGKR